MARLKDWVRQGRENGASDLHIEAGSPLVVRVRGELHPLGEALSAENVFEAARELLGSELWRDFTARGSVDLSRTLSGVRCRVNVYQTMRGVGLAVRLLSAFNANLNDCNLHPDLRRLLTGRSGLVLVSGPTGSGKSTTLAALIEELNASSRRHIITLESPIEYYFSNRKSFIRQREIPTHSPSFEQALTDAMRENPDVLVIGEMRTPEVMRLTLNAAETGHLVLATVHSSTCAEALARLCMSFPSEIQSGVRAQLADSLLGVVCQRLTFLPSLGFSVPYCEILFANAAVRATVRGGQFSQLASAIQTGGEEGMWSFDRYQRWMDQKHDWVRPSQAAALRDEVEEPARPTTVRPAAPAPRPATQTTGPAVRREKAPVPSQEGRIEIKAVDEDLESLARRITSTSKDDDSENSG